MPGDSNETVLPKDAPRGGYFTFSITRTIPARNEKEARKVFVDWLHWGFSSKDIKSETEQAKREVTDEMLNAALTAYQRAHYKTAIGEFPDGIHRDWMREALEAALNG